MSVRIFAMTHKKFDVPQEELYIPMHVGHAKARQEYGYLGDDTGDNISKQNCYYAELSGVYWVWKNYTESDYVGICHYRRFLTNEDNKAFTEEQYEELLQQYDIITTKELELPNSYHYGFGAHHKIETLDETGEIIKELYPDYYDNFIRLVHDNKTYFGNIMVTSKPLYDEYCEWLFTVLFELQKRIDLTFEDDYHRRVFGFISEFLLLVWVRTRGLQVLECRVAIIGDKTETREIKEQMAVYFRKRDAAGAKEYFAQCLKNRPDVLMEASDVTGECKLCLQAVSTANLEIQTYGHCFLEHISEYDEIISYFRRINDIVVRRGRNERTAEDEEWLGKYAVTEIALYAAARIYGISREDVL